MLVNSDVDQLYVHPGRACRHEADAAVRTKRAIAAPEFGPGEKPAPVARPLAVVSILAIAFVHLTHRGVSHQRAFNQDATASDRYQLYAGGTVSRRHAHERSVWEVTRVIKPVTLMGCPIHLFIRKLPAPEPG